MARDPAWLWSRSTALLALGFAVNFAGLLGGAMWLAPAQRAADDAAGSILRESTRARLIRDAMETAKVSDHLGSLVFSVPVGDDPTDEHRQTLAEIFTRAIARRHEAVRAAIAELAIAGAVDFAPTRQRYDALVAAERANYTMDTYRAANAFAADLALAMVDAEGAASMKALRLETTRREAKAAAAQRRLVLTLTAAAGAAIIFVATLSGQKTPPAASSEASRALEAALRRLQGSGRQT